jgi:hypothetical protein
VNTIASHLAGTTMFAARHLGFGHVVAAPAMATRATGGLALAVALFVTGFLVAIAWTARRMAALLGQFLQVAAAMTSVLFTMVLAVVVGLALLVHH